MQRLLVCGHNRELPAQQHAGIYHWMTVSVEPGSRRYDDSSNGNLGLTLRMERKSFPSQLLVVLTSSSTAIESSLDSCHIGKLAQLS